MKMHFVWRGLDWLFRRDWYSFTRFKYPQYICGQKEWIIDVGCFSICFISKVNRRR